jgi:hypothetical protein
MTEAPELKTWAIVEMMGHQRPAYSPLCAPHSGRWRQIPLDAPRFFDILKPYRKVKAILYGHPHRCAGVWRENETSAFAANHRGAPSSVA